MSPDERRHARPIGTSVLDDRSVRRVGGIIAEVTEVVAAWSEAVVALRRGAELLFLRRTGDDAWGGLWWMPGGAVEDGETPAQAALREAYEETGYRLGSVEEVTVVVDHIPSGGVCAVHLFLADAPAGDPSLNDEHDAWTWAPAGFFYEQDIDNRCATSADFEVWMAVPGVLLAAAG
jgi:8-oxo-dGTP pyrophosphatase MutT (NUDIX family)